MSNLKLPAVQSFADAWNWLRDKRTIGKGDRFAYCTTLRITNGGVAATVRHHQTDIIVYWHDGSIVLDDGGWGSCTTADRMNRLTPDWLCVRTRKGETQVSDDGGKTYMPLRRRTTFTPPGTTAPSSWPTMA